jgi:hypothetical protein
MKVKNLLPLAAMWRFALKKWFEKLQQGRYCQIFKKRTKSMDSENIFYKKAN